MQVMKREGGMMGRNDGDWGGRGRQRERVGREEGVNKYEWEGGREGGRERGIGEDVVGGRRGLVGVGVRGGRGWSKTGMDEWEDGREWRKGRIGIGKDGRE